MQDGGWVHEAFARANDKGFCEGNKFITGLAHESGTGSLDDPYTLRKRLIAIESLLESTSNESENCFLNINSEATLLVQSLFPMLKSVVGAIQLLEKKSFSELVNIACGQRFSTKYFDIKGESWPPQQPEKILDIQKELLSGRIVGMDLDFKPLTKEGENPLHFLLSKKKLCEKMDEFRYGFIHAVAIVGQRENKKTGQCEIIIRNSWGNDCSSFRKALLSCDPESGDLYVPAATLSTLGYGINRIIRTAE